MIGMKPIVKPASSDNCKDVRQEIVKFFDKMGLLHIVSPLLPQPPKEEESKEPESPKPLREEIFKGVVAFVEIRCSSDDVSGVFARKLAAAGAEIAPSVTKKVTHVLFKEGKLSTYKKAVQRSIPVVNVLWVVESFKLGKRLPIDEFVVPEPAPLKKHKLPSHAPINSPMSPEELDWSLKYLKKLMKASSEPRQITKPKPLSTASNLDTPLDKRKLVTSKVADFSATVSKSLPRKRKSVKENPNRVQLNRKRLFVGHSESPPKRPKSEHCKNAAIVESLIFPSKHRDSLDDFQIKTSSINKFLTSDTKNNVRAKTVSKDIKLEVGEGSSPTSQTTLNDPAICAMPVTNTQRVPESVAVIDHASTSETCKSLNTKDKQEMPTVAVEQTNNCNESNTALHSIAHSAKAIGKSGRRKSSVSYSPRTTREGIKKSTRKKMAAYEEESPEDNLNNEVVNLSPKILSSTIELNLKNPENETSEEKRIAISPESNGVENMRPQIRRSQRHNIAVSVLKTPISEVPMPPTRPSRLTVSHSNVVNTKIPSDPQTKPVESPIKRLSPNLLLVNGGPQSVPRNSRNSKVVTSSESTNSLVSISNTCDEKIPVVSNNSGSKNHKGNLPFIATTNCSQADKEAVAAVVKNLGSFQMQSEVVPGTTHLVCGNKKRTLNLLFAIVYGCWVLPPEWVFKSLEAGRWLDEESFELVDYYPVVKTCRQKHQMSGLDQDEKPALLSSFGPYYVSPNSSVPVDRLTSLIAAAGGKVVSCARQCEVMVDAPQDTVNRSKYRHFVSSKWILDCIMKQEVLPMF